MMRFIIVLRNVGLINLIDHLELEKCNFVYLMIVLGENLFKLVELFKEIETVSFVNKMKRNISLKLCFAPMKQS